MATATLLKPAEFRWYCPNCNATKVTQSVHAGRALRPGENVAVMHHCPGLGGVAAPLVPVGTKAKVVAVEREDYLNGDDAQCTDEGKPIMAVITIREDGSDCAVLAPTARTSLGE